MAGTRFVDVADRILIDTSVLTTFARAHYLDWFTKHIAPMAYIPKEIVLEVDNLADGPPIRADLRQIDKLQNALSNLRLGRPMFLDDHTELEVTGKARRYQRQFGSPNGRHPDRDYGEAMLPALALDCDSPASAIATEDKRFARSATAFGIPMPDSAELTVAAARGGSDLTDAYNAHLAVLSARRVTTLPSPEEFVAKVAADGPSISNNKYIVHAAGRRHDTMDLPALRSSTYLYKAEYPLASSWTLSPDMDPLLWRNKVIKHLGSSAFAALEKDLAAALEHGRSFRGWGFQPIPERTGAFYFSIQPHGSDNRAVMTLLPVNNVAVVTAVGSVPNSRRRSGAAAIETALQSLLAEHDEHAPSIHAAGQRRHRNAVRTPKTVDNPNSSSNAQRTLASLGIDPSDIAGIADAYMNTRANILSTIVRTPLPEGQQRATVELTTTSKHMDDITAKGSAMNNADYGDLERLLRRRLLLSEVMEDSETAITALQKLPGQSTRAANLRDALEAACGPEDCLATMLRTTAESIRDERPDASRSLFALATHYDRTTTSEPVIAF